MKNTNNQTTDVKWKTLYLAGALAPLIALAFYTFQMVIMGFGEALPATMDDWFLLFQGNKILGLIYLNALDPFSIALLGMMFLALYIALSLLSTVKMKLIRTQTGYPSAQHNQEQWLASSRNLVNKLSTAELSTWFKMHRI